MSKKNETKQRNGTATKPAVATAKVSEKTKQKKVKGSRKGVLKKGSKEAEALKKK